MGGSSRGKGRGSVPSAMTTRDAPPPSMLRLQRKNFFIGAVALMGGLVMHCLLTWSLPPPLIAAQVVSSTTLTLLGLGVGARWVSMNWAAAIASIFAFASSALFVQMSGGPFSPYFQVFFVIPFLLSMFAPDLRMPTLVSGAMGLVTVVGMNVLAHVALVQIFLQVTCFLMVLGLTLAGSSVYRRMLDNQAAAHAQRLQALERLAESERLRVRSERERSEVERLVLAGQLAAGVAHEVNNPLAYVKANLSHLQRQTQSLDEPLDRDELREVLEETQQGVLRIQQIVMDLKSFSRAGGMGEEEGGRLGDAVQEARRLVAVRMREGDEVSVELAAELPVVKLGQRHLVQVMVNLLINAADAVEEARPARQVRIAVSARRVDAGVRLCVDDNGPGIPEETLARLFQPFFTTKPPGKGTGLGLALCREYVARVGGTLHAENHAGGGARFVMMLPPAEAPAVARA